MALVSPTDVLGGHPAHKPGHPNNTGAQLVSDSLSLTGGPGAWSPHNTFRRMEWPPGE